LQGNVSQGTVLCFRMSYLVWF